jgi:hypothetical protein
MGRPATGQTPGHTVRVPTRVWDEAEARVGKRHMAALITRLLERDNATAARRGEAGAQQAHHRAGDPRNSDPANLEVRDEPDGPVS